jgi:hypothetical protein
MTTLQVETKAFPTSIPNTISHDPVSPSSQFLSFYSASEGLGRAESISSPDEQGVPSQDIGPASRRVEAEKLASKPRVGAAASRSKAKPGRQNNFTRPLSQVEDVRSRYRDSNTYTFEQSGTIPFRPRVIPRYGPQQITKDVERREFRRPVREDSDLSIEEIRREFPLPALGSADYEARIRRLNGLASDSSSEDDGPIIPRNRWPENRYDLPSQYLSQYRNSDDVGSVAFRMKGISPQAAAMASGQGFDDGTTAASVLSSFTGGVSLRGLSVPKVHTARQKRQIIEAGIKMRKITERSPSP